jgi:hypothetical protein
MPKQAMSHTCSCSCGASKVQVAATPLLRFICHCTICQAVFKRPYADVMVYWAGDVSLQENHAIQFKKYRLPPAVNRGLCSACDSPMLGILRLAPFVRLAFVATSNYPEQAILPEPDVHIFYHSRVADIENAVPKYNGYWRSQMAIASLITSAVLHRV